MKEIGRRVHKQGRQFSTIPHSSDATKKDSDLKGSALSSTDLGGVQSELRAHCSLDVGLNEFREAAGLIPVDVSLLIDIASVGGVERGGCDFVRLTLIVGPLSLYRLSPRKATGCLLSNKLDATVSCAPFEGVVGVYRP
jgi:hypothetical protein